MTQYDIESCNDINKLKQICLAQKRQLNIIGEILVDESKSNIIPEKAISVIRDYMVKSQQDINMHIIL